MLKNSNKHTFANTYLRTYTCMQACMRSYMRTNTYIHTHAHTHRDIYIDIYIYVIYTYIYIYMQRCRQAHANRDAHRNSAAYGKWSLLVCHGEVELISPCGLSFFARSQRGTMPLGVDFKQKMASHRLCPASRCFGGWKLQQTTRRFLIEIREMLPNCDSPHGVSKMSLSRASSVCFERLFYMKAEDPLSLS